MSLPWVEEHPDVFNDAAFTVTATDSLDFTPPSSPLKGVLVMSRDNGDDEHGLEGKITYLTNIRLSRCEYCRIIPEGIGYLPSYELELSTYDRPDRPSRHKIGPSDRDDHIIRLYIGRIKFAVHAKGTNVRSSVICFMALKNIETTTDLTWRGHPGEIPSCLFNRFQN